MATYRIIRGATTYDISAGQPIYLAEVDDLGGASVRNQEESGPFQDGASHLGERLEPRSFALRLNVKALTAAALDGYRDILNAMFKPIRGVPITVEVVRDDGETRRLDCRRAGPLAVPLRPTDINLHRAVVMLRAAEPTWYDPDEEELTYSGGAFQWYTGYNTIATEDVLEFAQTPTAGQLWANAGSVVAGSAWTVFFRSPFVATGAGSQQDAFSINVPEVSGTDPLFQTLAAGNYTITIGASGLIQGAGLMTAGTHNYYLVYSGGGTAIWYQNVTALGTTVAATAVTIKAAAAGTERWRSNYISGAVDPWPVALPYAAAYKKALSAAERAALNTATTAGSIFTAAIVYEGDWDSYPVITLNGPLANPDIINTTTGDRLNFSGAGGSVPAGQTWVIDTRYGRKSVLNGTVSVASYLSDDSDLVTFKFSPDPIAPGGTNVLTISGSLVGTATSAQIAFFHRFMGF